MKTLIVALTLLALLVVPTGRALAAPNRSCVDGAERALYMLVLRARTENGVRPIYMDRTLSVQAVYETRSLSGAGVSMVTTGTDDPFAAFDQFWADPQNAVRMTDSAYTGVGIALRIHGTQAHPRYTWALVFGEYQSPAIYCRPVTGA